MVIVIEKYFMIRKLICREIGFNFKVYNTSRFEVIYIPSTQNMHFGEIPSSLKRVKHAVYVFFILIDLSGMC